MIQQGQCAINAFISDSISLTNVRDSATKKAGIKVLQHAMNLDYGSALKVDGILGLATKTALGSHYVTYGEIQYMVTACQILLLLHGIQPNGVEYPGIFRDGCLAAVKNFQTKNKLSITGICDTTTFLKLVE